ncbi:MAG: class I SAM-dependent methyltransferase [Myxococcales bacterium]|nr:class I SAM-dependent methyltransferase [Myxococcales bacterium]
MSSPAGSFSDPQAVARYAEGPRRVVPGYASLHRMVGLLIAERAPASARVLVVGAGGGLELRDLAHAHPGWTFDGVDPSAEMIDLARVTLGSLASRVELHHGRIGVAPPGPFDAATCLLTMHFLEQEERRALATEARRRLAPGAPFVVVHLSLPQGTSERERWLSRYAAFAVASGVEPDKAAAAREGIADRLPIVSPEVDEAILRDAGFDGVELFYAGFAFRGWVGHA